MRADNPQSHPQDGGKQQLERDEEFLSVPASPTGRTTRESSQEDKGSGRKVLGVFWHGFPQRNGPVYSHTFVMMKCLAGSPSNLTFFTNAKSLSEKPEERYEGVRVRRVQYLLRKKAARFPAKFILYLREFFLPFWREVRNHDLVFVRDQMPTVVFLSRLARKPIVVEKNDIDYRDPAIKTEKETIIGRLGKAFRLRLLNFVSAVQIMTEEQREALVNVFNIEESKLILIPNGVDTSKFVFSPKRVEFPFKLLYIGSLDENHSLNTTLTAVKSLHNRAVLTVVGDGVKRKDFEMRAKDLNLANVEFLGKIPHEEVPKIIQEHDFCVCEYNPVTEEFKKYGFYGVPLKIFEYLAVGRAVFVNVMSSGLQRLAREKVLFYFKTPEELAKMVSYFSTHQEELLKTQKKARMTAEKHDWKRLSNALLERLKEKGLLER